MAGCVRGCGYHAQHSKLVTPEAHRAALDHLGVLHRRAVRKKNRPGAGAVEAVEAKLTPWSRNAEAFHSCIDISGSQR